MNGNLMLLILLLSLTIARSMLSLTTHSDHELRCHTDHWTTATGQAFTETDSEGEALRQRLQHSATPAGFTSIEHSFGQMSTSMQRVLTASLKKILGLAHSVHLFFPGEMHPLCTLCALFLASKEPCALSFGPLSTRCHSATQKETQTNKRSAHKGQ